MDEFEASVSQALALHGLVRPRMRVVIGVSGGADSVALLRALAALAPAWQLTLFVAHLNHGLRAEADGEAEFVRELSRTLGLESSMGREDVAARCTEAGWSLEDGARRLRRRFLLRAARQWDAEAVALAHTADDQAETVLMRLLRGTGLSGLGAMPFKRPFEERWLIRPLLALWRRDILAYLGRSRGTFREDATNRDLRFTRNRIRLELLPLLERDYNRNIKRALAQLAEQSQTDYGFLEHEAGRWWKRAVKGSGVPGELAISITAFLRQPKALQRQLVRQAIEQVKGEPGQLEYRHWLETDRLFRERPPGTQLDLPGGVQLRREPDRVVLGPSGGRPPVASTP